MNMSITPSREAIHRLSSEGLIELGSHHNAECVTILLGMPYYVTARLLDGETLPLMRLRYGGSAARLGFAVTSQ